MKGRPVVSIRKPGLSGLAVAAVGTGMLLTYAAIGNASVSDTVRSLLKGTPLPSKGSTLDASRADVGTALGAAAAKAAADAAASAQQGIGAAPGTAGILGGLGAAIGNATLGARIAAAAQSHLGKPYKFATAGPNTFDCSGLVTYVLHHDVGLNLPSNSHTVTGQFYVWTGATTVDRPPQAGDLICWPSHIGIAIDATRMVVAPSAGRNVQIENIWWKPLPLVRRVKPQ